MQKVWESFFGKNPKKKEKLYKFPLSELAFPFYSQQKRTSAPLLSKIFGYRFVVTALITTF